MTYRTPTFLLTLIALAALSLAGCKTGSTSPAQDDLPPETFFFEVTDNTGYEAKAELEERLAKALEELGYVRAADMQSADHPLSILMSTSSVAQLSHDGPGSPPLLPLGPLSALVNGFYYLGWAAKETGKQAVNAGTPNSVVLMRLDFQDARKTVWLVTDEIPLYSLDREKSRERVAREAADIVAAHVEACRSEKMIESAVKETNVYVLGKFPTASN